MDRELNHHTHKQWRPSAASSSPRPLQRPGLTIPLNTKQPGKVYSCFSYLRKSSQPYAIPSTPGIYHTTTVLVVALPRRFALPFPALPGGLIGWQLWKKGH
jgi:hypothetical protein